MLEWIYNIGRGRDCLSVLISNIEIGKKIPKDEILDHLKFIKQMIVMPENIKSDWGHIHFGPGDVHEKD